VDHSQPTSEADLEMTLRHTAPGPPSFGEDQPWDFALQWEPAYIRDRVWPMVSRLLVDADPVVRARSVEFVNAWSGAEAATIQRLIEVATQHASLYREPGLQTLLSFALSNKAISVHANRATIAKAILALLGGAPPRGATTLVAEYEPEALIRSAGQWTADSEDQRAARSAAGAMAMYHRDHLLALLAALAGRSVADREEILEDVTDELGLPDEKLRLILARDSLPFPATHPTVEDCRRALGLPPP